jgi:broad specificity phosphatase PhoE
LQHSGFDHELLGQPSAMATSWPSRLQVVRHGESAGNVARDLAEASGLERIALDHRDVDVPLSDRGISQAEGLGRYLRDHPDERPELVWVSPYVRAQQTAAHALKTAGLALPVHVDERLREREFGVLDGLTHKGIAAQWPEEAERRKQVGKFYHRPPGGESWTDALLRVRSLVTDLRRDTAGARVMVVAHQVVVSLFRYVIEDLTEAEVLALGEVANCSVTTFAPDERGNMELVTFNDVDHLREQQQPVTTEPDTPHAPR